MLLRVWLSYGGQTAYILFGTSSTAYSFLLIFTYWHPRLLFWLQCSHHCSLPDENWTTISRRFDFILFLHVDLHYQKLIFPFIESILQHIIENVGGFLLSCLEVLHNLLRIRAYSSAFTHIVILKLDLFYLLLFEISSILFLQMQLNLYVKAVNLSAQMMVS